MDRCFSYDRDGDGLIENEGQADQTYDSWVMHGPSAYCCSLWVAALAVMVEMASELKDEAEEKKFAEALAKARVALQEKLWNGKGSGKRIIKSHCVNMVFIRFKIMIEFYFQ